LSEAVKEAMTVIKDQGLDDLPEYQEATFPLPETLRWTFIDDLVNEGYVNEGDNPPARASRCCVQ